MLLTSRFNSDIRRPVFRRTHMANGVWRHVFLTLASLSVAMRILIPQGFMAAPSSQDEPFAIVLCTGHGPMVMDSGGRSGSDHSEQDAPDKSGHDSVCAFAGHGLAGAVPGLFDADPAHAVAYERLVPASPVSVSPGRGVSGPPLPARGPPVLLS